MDMDGVPDATAYTSTGGEYAFVRTHVVKASGSDPGRLFAPAPMD
jgi:hypothetical protein